MRVLLTGASGFVGRHILASPHGADLTFIWATRANRPSSASELALGPGPWTVGDVRRALDASKADVVMHCAGVTHASGPRGLFEANTLLTATILEAVASAPCRPRVVLAGSSAEYGFVQEVDLPVTEDYACWPESTYGIAKYAQTLLSLAAVRRGLEVLVIRLFNPVGRGMPRHLALPSFARRITAAPPVGGAVRVGNLDIARDFLDAGEAARIMIALARQPVWPWRIVNLCSGAASQLAPMIQALIKFSGKSIDITTDPELQRPGEMTTFVGSTARLRAIGLAPVMPDLEALCRTLLNEASAKSTTGC